MMILLVVRISLYLMIINVLIVNLIANNTIVDPLKDDAIFNLINRKENTTNNNSLIQEFYNIIEINRAAINYKNDKGLTPLMLAAGLGNKDIAQILLENGADCNVKDNINGQTALHFASYKKNHDIIRLILERFDVGIKVEVNAKTLDIGNTALHIAVQNRDTKSIELLFDKRWLSYVFINIQNNDFKPPLWLAAEQNYTEICKLLIFKGSATEIIQGTLTDKSIRNNKHLSKSSKVINYTTNKNTEKVISKSMEKMGGNHIIYRDNIPTDSIQNDQCNNSNSEQVSQKNPLDVYRDYIEIFGDDKPINSTTKVDNDNNNNNWWSPIISNFNYTAINDNDSNLYLLGIIFSIGMIVCGFIILSIHLYFSIVFPEVKEKTE